MTMLFVFVPGCNVTRLEVPTTTKLPSLLTAVTWTNASRVGSVMVVLSPAFNVRVVVLLSEIVCPCQRNWLNAGGLGGGATMMMVMLTQLMSPPAWRQTSAVNVPFGVVVSGSTVTRLVSVAAPRVLPFSGSTYQNESNLQPLAFDGKPNWSPFKWTSGPAKPVTIPAVFVGLIRLPEESKTARRHLRDVNDVSSPSALLNFSPLP